MKNLKIYIFSIHVGIFIITLLSTSFAKRNDKMRWDRAEKEVGKSFYLKEFKDSISNANNVTNIRDLRQLSGHPLPFLKREKLVYKGGWGFINAGFGIFDANIDEQTGLLKITGKAVTNNFVSAFYKVRDYVQTIIDIKGFYPIFFEQHIRENRYKKNTWIIFDHEHEMAYSNRRKKGSREYEIKPFAHDYLSLLYYLRTLDFAPGDTFSIDCFVKGKVHPVFFQVHGKEEIKVGAGTFNCIKVQPRLVGDGRGFTRKDKMFLWFTDDKYHMLVKGKSRVSIGNISAELLLYKRD